VILSVMPSPCAMPFVRVVLPVPMSPVSSMVFGGVRLAARVLPRAIISDSEWIIMNDIVPSNE